MSFLCITMVIKSYLKIKAAEVIQVITAIKCTTKQAKENQQKLISYYQNNLLRMDYARYRTISC